jgi:hypothetical protein
MEVRQYTDYAATAVAGIRMREAGRPVVRIPASFP